MNIGKYLKLSDLTFSQTASNHGVENSPSPTQVDALTNVVKFVYDPLCDHLGGVHVNSGFRSVAVNKLIGGSATSQHCKGEALDLSFNGVKTVNTNSTIFYYILHNLEFDQLIWEFGTSKEPQWVHVSYSTKFNRKEVLKSVKIGTKTVYQTFDNTLLS